MANKHVRPLVLLVMDGWGIAKPGPGNAISLAKPKNFLKLATNNPYAQLSASGKDVGLLPGYIGNSEVGHLHLGAGRLEEQDLSHILREIKDGRFYKNKVLLLAMKKAQKHRLHLLGLLSDGGVHSHIQHLYGLLELAHRHHIQEVYVHVITDGRDVPPKSAEKYLQALSRKLKSYSKHWHIATIMGRYYAMDRDQRWNREAQAYAAMVRDEGRSAKTWQEALRIAYDAGETDEFIKPTNITGNGSYNIANDDVCIFFNFRSDRARQITRSFVDKTFNKFKRTPLRLHFVCLTQYDERIKTPVAYPPRIAKNGMGEVISKKRLRQLRVAETEKWAHVTYFFNGLRGKPFPLEDRRLIPSRKVATYDKTPDMRVKTITNFVIQELKKRTYSFILINYANADMVGHTGDKRATIEAIRAQDAELGKLAHACEKHGYTLAITADHGNAEQVRYSDGSICTAHTTNNVPLIIQSPFSVSLKKSGKLYQVAPTCLSLMGITPPSQMASSLLRKS